MPVNYSDINFTGADVLEAQARSKGERGDGKPGTIY
jgi:hypothetical protein